MEPYAVAIFAMLLSGASALTLFAAIRHIDPPEAKAAPTREPARV